MLITPLCAQERNPLDLHKGGKVEYVMKTDTYNDSIKSKFNNKRKKPIYKKKGFLVGGAALVYSAFRWYKKNRDKKKDPIVPQSPDNKDPIQPPNPLSLHFLKYNNQLLGDDIMQKKKKYDLKINLSLSLWKW